MRIHRREEIWGEKCMEFNPDNFLPENMEKRHLLSYLPFSFGARNCIGYKFADYAMKITLAHLLRNYKFTTQLKMKDLKFSFGMTLNILNNQSILIHKR